MYFATFYAENRHFGNVEGNNLHIPMKSVRVAGLKAPGATTLFKEKNHHFHNWVIKWGVKWLSR